MRTLKFRAWDKHENKWIPEDELCIGLDGSLSGYYTGKCLNEEISIMQYTGIKDKNGVEIYEGDIVKVFDEDIRTVVYGVEKWDYPAFDLDPIVGEIDCNGLQNAVIENECKVIGNIYENPELLKEVA